MYKYLYLYMAMAILQTNIHVFFKLFFTILYVRSLPSYIYGLYRSILAVFTVIIDIY